MDRPLLREQAPAEYFKELVDSALARQRIQAGDLTAYYLVNLLCQFVRPDARGTSDLDAEPLAYPPDAGAADRRIGAARTAAQPWRFLAVHVAVSSPTASAARTVDVDYYVSMGEYAYGRSAAATRMRLPRCSASSRASLSDTWTSWRTSANGRPLDVERRPPSALREVAAHRQLARRQEADRSRIVPNASIGKRFIQ